MKPTIPDVVVTPESIAYANEVTEWGIEQHKRIVDESIARFGQRGALGAQSTVGTLCSEFVRYMLKKVTDPATFSILEESMAQTRDNIRKGNEDL